MPMFEFVCDSCGKRDDRIIPHAKIEEQKCECGEKMRRVFSPYLFQFDFRPGFDVGLGEYIATKKQRDNLVAEKGLRRILS
jgi:putative FmdB family regulatory protein